jgi:N6-adenosine-specific RNA methylase IME4
MTPAQRQARYRKNLRAKPKRERRQAREAELAAATINASLVAGSKLYGVIYADPPWRFEPWSRETGMDRAADNHYPTMPTSDIRAIKVPAAKNCVLFLCATMPMLKDALAVIEAWGFRYKSGCVWVKDRAATGYWFRFRHELLLVATRGNVPAPAPGEQWDSVIEAAVGRHSEKPAAIAEMIEHYFPTTPKLEMFARAPRDGWDAWGNEVVIARPQRFQLRRTKGWRKPEGGRSVARPTRWGNPFSADPGRRRDSEHMHVAELVAKYRAWVLDANRSGGPTIAEIRRELRGRDLGCWCPLDMPCHADVLLEVANRED